MLMTLGHHRSRRFHPLTLAAILLPLGGAVAACSDSTSELPVDASMLDESRPGSPDGGADASGTVD